MNVIVNDVPDFTGTLWNGKKILFKSRCYHRHKHQCDSICSRFFWVVEGEEDRGEGVCDYYLREFPQALGPRRT